MKYSYAFPSLKTILGLLSWNQEDLTVSILSVFTCYIKSTKLIGDYELALLLVEDLMTLPDDLQLVLPVLSTSLCPPS